MRGRSTTDAPTPPRVAAITPSRGSPMVERARLDHRYADARGRLVRVLGPAGYGKTTLVARWVRSDDRNVCWLDIDRGDDDPIALFAKLRKALVSTVAIAEPSRVSAPTTNPYVEAIRSALTDHRAEPFVLVLDDVHRLHGTPTAWIVETLVECLPPSSTVVLAGRSHHDHGTIGALRLSPGVVDVSVDDLVFDASETHRFLTSMGIDAGASGVSETLTTLAGWPAGLRLAANAIQRGIDPPDAADHATLVDYLRNEWLVSLEPQDHEFLREIACLENFTGATCDEILGRTGSAAMLEHLHRNTHVVFGLDQRGEWYRLHPLLSRWLSADLRSSDPHRWTEIHVVAARFCEREDDIDRAVGYARAAGEMTLLETLVVTHGGSYFTRGAVATVTRWLEAFPPEQVRASPGLCAVHCLAELHLGDEARASQWQRLLNDAVDVRGRIESDPTTWWPDVISAALDERPARASLSAVTAARAHLTHGPWGAFACWVQGGLAFLDGDPQAALEALAAGVFEAELTGNPATQSHCLATAAVIDDCLGATDEAAVNTRRCAELLQSCGAELTPTAAIDLAVTALVSARQDERDTAARQLASARRALSCFPQSAPWFNVIARLPLARTALLLDDRTLGGVLMREIEHHARFELPHRNAPAADATNTATSGAEGGAMACLAELRRQVDAMHRPATGATALTGAELKVLRLMPTNLSLGDIATRLFVSRNTVKSHAASIYRKLGADNRRQAVESAAAAGVIETA